MKRGHGERQSCVKIRPAPVQDLLEVTDERQHRQHRLDQHAVLPLLTLAEFEVRGIALCRMKGGIAQDDHASVKLPNQPLKRLVDVSTIRLSSNTVAEIHSLERASVVEVE